MKLYEFEAKTLFQQAGIPTPRGAVAADAAEAAAIADRIGYPVVLKAQVLRGGRGKLGAVCFAHGASELAAAADRLFGAPLGDETIDRLLIEAKIAAAQEYYLAITLDPRTLSPVLIVSPQGGIDIEAAARKAPRQMLKRALDPTRVPRLHHLLELTAETGLASPERLKLARVMLQLIDCYFRYEALTAEINPLIVDAAGDVFAADGKFEIDDSALFRVTLPWVLDRRAAASDDLEAQARAAGLSYVRLGEGNIGIISGGAGLAMASMDMVAARGGAPANFLDLGGGTTPAKTAAALEIVLQTPGVEGILFNVFGGINNCAEMARGIARVVDALHPPQAIVVKMRGFSQEEGWALLQARNIPIVKYGTTEDAVELLLERMQTKGCGSSGDTCNP